MGRTQRSPSRGNGISSRTAKRPANHDGPSRTKCPTHNDKVRNRGSGTARADPLDRKARRTLPINATPTRAARSGAPSSQWKRLAT